MSLIITEDCINHYTVKLIKDLIMETNELLATNEQLDKHVINITLLGAISGALEMSDELKKVVQE